MQRIDCLTDLAQLVGDDIAVIALSGTADEWHHVRPSDANFFNVAMGSNVPLAMGLAFALPHRRIVLIDTDGCLLMTLGALCTLGNYPPPNLRVFVMDNGAYARSGALPSATSGKTRLDAIARAAGIDDAVEVSTLEDFKAEARRTMAGDHLSVVVAKVEPRAGFYMRLGFSHVEGKFQFVRYIERTENKQILSTR